MTNLNVKPASEVKSGDRSIISSAQSSTSSDHEDPSHTSSADPHPTTISEPYAAINRLPDEILSLIISTFTSKDQETLASLCAVSKKFQSIAHPVLYKWVTLAPADGYISSQDPSFRSVKVDNLTGQTSKSLKYLSIAPHHQEWCAQLAGGLQLPHLEVLNIALPTNQPHGWDAHLQGHVWYLTTSCNLLSNCDPKVLILRGNHNVSLRLFTLRGYLAVWTRLEILIFVSPYRCGDSYWSTIDSSTWSFPALKGEIRKIIWIFEPNSHTPSDRYPSINELPFAPLPKDFSKTKITVVNYDWLLPGSLRNSLSIGEDVTLKDILCQSKKTGDI